jgi:serine/threonine-protein kinase RsbT
MDNTIFISSDLDVVMARIEARKLAKQMGFNTADQARISLAASELARALSWNNEAPGEIVFSPTSQNGQQGIQVVCFVKREFIEVAPNGDLSPRQEISIPNRCLTGARQLVDESFVKEQGDQKAQLVLIKWLN